MENLKQIANQTIEQLVKAGANKAQCVVTEVETQEFNVDAGTFSLYRTLFDQYISMTAFKDHKKGTTSINHFDEESIETAVKNCITVADSGHPDDAYDIAPNQGEKMFVSGPVEPEIDRFFDRTVELMEDIKKRHPLILVEQMVVQHVKKHSVYQNTNGTTYDVTNGAYVVEVVFAGHEGELTSSMYGSQLLCNNLDLPFIERASLERDFCDVEKQIHTVPLQGKFEGVVVFTPACLEQMMVSLCNNFVSDYVLINGTSIWKEKLYQKVADERVNLSIAPLDERIVGSEHCTGDGFVSQNYELIQHGQLKSYMLSLYGANKTGLEPAKNSSYNMVMEGGDLPLNDLIKQIKHGIIVARYSGGEPSTNGEFSGVAKNSFLIEDGKITDSLTETMINGNLSEMLQNVVGISKEVVSNGSTVFPYVACDHIMISGK